MNFLVIIVTLLFPATILIPHYSSDQLARAQTTISCFTSSNPADSDGDGLPDDWENNGVPYTKSDGTTGRYKLPESNPNHKNLYIELDAMQNQKVLNDALFDVVTSFQNAPVKNPDCLAGINLHIGVSDQNVPQQENTDIPELQQLKNIWFGDPFERSDINHEGLLAAKDKAYYYVLFAHNQPGTTSSGKAENIPGRSLLVTLGGSSGWAPDPTTQLPIGSRDQQAGTLMHEFGHLLGLHHGGNDEINYKPNYDSVMSYLYQFADLVSDRSLDYSNCALPTLNENTLNEKVGIGNNNCPHGQGFRTALDAKGFFEGAGANCPDPTTIVPEGGTAVDYNHNNIIETFSYPRDINCDDFHTPITSYDDWSHIVYLANPGASTSGASPSLIGGNNTAGTTAHTGAQPVKAGELTFEDVQQHRALLLQGLQQLVQKIPLRDVNNTASALAGLVPRSAVNGSAATPTTTAVAAATTSYKAKNTILNQIGDPAKVVTNASRQNLTGATAGAAIRPAINPSGAAATINPSISSLIASNHLPQAINQLNSIESTLTGSSSSGGISSTKVLANPTDLRKVTVSIENIKGALAKQIITPEETKGVSAGQVISPSSIGIPSVSTTTATTANIAAESSNTAQSNAISGPANANVMWISHLDLLPGDPSVKTSFNAISSGVGNGLSGLIIQSNTIGDNATQGGNKVVQKALEVPPGHTIKGIRLCYELSNNRTFINLVRLAQVQNPPDRAVVLLDDSVSLNNKGPICVNSQQISSSTDPANGPLLLSLRINSGDASDRIVIRGLGLLLG